MRYIPVAVLTTLVACSCARDTAHPAVTMPQPFEAPPWLDKGPPVTRDDLRRARISVLVGGDWYVGGYIVVATPNVTGGYDVRVETTNADGGDFAPPRLAVLEYRITPARASALRQTLAERRLTELPEFSNICHGAPGRGFDVNFIDLPDGRRLVFETPRAGNAKVGVCATAIRETLACLVAWRALLPEERRAQLVYEDLREATAPLDRDDVTSPPPPARLLRRPKRATVQELKSMSGAELMRYRGELTPEASTYLLRMQSAYLSCRGMNGSLASMDINTDDARRAVCRAMSWCRRSPAVLHLLTNEIDTALQRAVDSRVPWVADVLLTALTDDAEDHDGRNLYRQHAPLRLARVAEGGRDRIMAGFVSALAHRDPYLGRSAAMGLVAMGATDTAPAVLARGRTRDFPADATIPACALALGARGAGPLIRQY